MKTVWELPQNYREICRIDLKNNKRLAILINVISLLIGAGMIVPVWFYKPPYLISEPIGLYKTVYLTSDPNDRISELLLFCIVSLLAMIGYVFLHEWVHGLCIRYFSGKKAHYGFTGLCAFAGSEAYFPKKPYIIIALAPVVVWGVVLTVLLFLVPGRWFWTVYLVQVCNFSGATGDLYVTWGVSRMSKEILVRDHGASMDFYEAM